MKRYEALARHPLAIAGALITTASAVVFIALLIAEFAGLFANPYAGLVVFIALPAVFLIGLLMIPAGMWLEQRRLLRDPTTPTDWPVIDLNTRRVRRTVLLFTALTAVNVVILLVAGYGSLHWMDSPQFCGQVCHEPMHPQFTAWRDGPHSRIACASCHIAEGAQGFVNAKLAGTRQLVHVITGNVPKPIPPGAHLPPGALVESCQSCHRPSRTGADRVRVIREYADDESNTETVTVLQMFMGGPTSAGHSIHWHADPANKIEYVATGSDRQTIIYIKATDAKGEVKEYRAADVTDQAISSGIRRTMDCADCHNTVGHPISPTAERMVDRAIAAGELSQKLPFARREGVRLVSASYSSQDEAANAIDRGIRDFYAKQSGADAQAVSRASAALQDVYRRNVFPAMKVTWGSYPENRVHIASPGCVRCHDDEHKAKDGSAINGDCEYCHKEIQQQQ
ncbi:MAG TPA: NapC/NirT family cytochrome c [Vicinamibacterales bacterium]|nr:NapC/NirT family cytochrome c [Vicinamibacterales bacterium]